MLYWLFVFRMSFNVTTVFSLRSSFILPEIISKNIGSYNLEERSVNYFVVKASDQKAKDFTDLEIMQELVWEFFIFLMQTVVIEIRGPRH